MFAAEVQLFPDETFFVQLALFLVTLAGLHFLVFRPVLRILRYRFEKTEGDRKRIAELTGKTETLVRTYEGRMQEAKTKAHAAKEAIRKEGADQAARLVHEAKQLRLQELERVRAEVNRAAAEAEKQLENQSKELGLHITEKILGRKMETNGH